MRRGLPANQDGRLKQACLPRDYEASARRPNLNRAQWQQSISQKKADRNFLPAGLFKDKMAEWNWKH